MAKPPADKPSRFPAGGPARPAVPRWLRAVAVFLLRLGLGLLAVFLLYAAYLDAVVTGTFEAHRWSVPARVYARPLELYAGKPLAPSALLAELQELGYRAVGSPAQAGEYSLSRDGNTVRLVSRGFVFPDGSTRPQSATIVLSTARVEKLVAADRVLRLEPVTIGALRPRDAEDRVLMRLADRPPLLVEALLAVEDRDFPDHFGISPRGMLRALFVNLSAGEVQQGGSTLTQQLVKNFYLDSERTLARKLNEAVMSVLLELHYDKQVILETYCNEIYLGQSGRRAVHGFALGSQYYFGRPVNELKLHEVALLAGLVKGPSQYNPWRHPERALARRNLVIDALLDTGSIDAQAAAEARRLPLGVLPSPRLRLNRYPAYMAIVRRELQQVLDDSVQSADGIEIFTTLDPAVQLAAESAVVDALAVIEQDNAIQGLETALVVATPQSGEIEAAVGGRDVDFAGFDRVSDARRTIGSLMKPVVLLTALQQPEKYSLASFVSDGPLVATTKGSAPWRPANYDHVSHGAPPGHDVMLVDVLANSWNLATARLGLDVGVGRVVAQAHALGITADLPPYPAVLLGSATLSPLEVLALYQPMAAGGVRIAPHAVRGVLAADHRVLFVRRREAVQVVAPATSYLLTQAMQEVMTRGTARSVYNVLPRELVAAGKTGTTDNARDSWFAGYTGNHLAISWVGYDDYRPTRLSGASGALRVWADFTGRLPQLPIDQGPPPGIAWAWLVPGGTALSAEGCPGAVRLPVVAASLPTATSFCGTATNVGAGVRGFFRRLFD